MPWRVQKDPRCPAGKPVAVILEADNSIVACHPNEVMANRQLSALYASHPEQAHKRPTPPPGMPKG